MNAKPVTRVFVGLAAMVLLVSCASQPSVPDERTLLLNALLKEIDDGFSETSRCLSTNAYGNVDIIDEEHLLFRGRGDKAWINKLRTKCYGLRRNDALVFELRSSSACVSDRVSALDRSGLGVNAGPSCALGEFKSIPPGYVRRINKLLRRK